MPKRNKKRKNKKRTPRPPSYASIVTTTTPTTAPTTAPTNDDGIKRLSDPKDDLRNIGPILSSTTRCVTNYTPPRGNSCRDTWEWAYFEHLLELRNIFIRGMKEINSNYVRQLYSPEFFDNFSQFIYEASSQYISPHLQPLSENLEQDYWTYLTNK